MFPAVLVRFWHQGTTCASYDTNMFCISSCQEETHIMREQSFMPYLLADNLLQP